MHAGLSVTTFDEQRELRMWSILSLLMHVFPEIRYRITKAPLRTIHIFDTLFLSEKVESVMRTHVRHFATNSIIFIIVLGKEGRVSFMGQLG